MNTEINIIAGIDKLLRDANVDILRLLLRDGYVDASVINDRTKQIYAHNTNKLYVDPALIDFLIEIDTLDCVLAQKFLNLVFNTARNVGGKYCLPMDVVRKLIIFGATIPSDPEYLCKLKLEDFVEQVELCGCPIDYKLEGKT